MNPVKDHDVMYTGEGSIKELIINNNDRHELHGNVIISISNGMNHKITIYGTQICPGCNAAKAHLKDKGFEYDFKDVREDSKAREEMLQKNEGLLSTPTIDIDGTIIVGFDEKKMDSLLE